MILSGRMMIEGLDNAFITLCHPIWSSENPKTHHVSRTVLHNSNQIKRLHGPCIKLFRTFNIFIVTSFHNFQIDYQNVTNIGYIKVSMDNCFKSFDHRLMTSEISKGLAQFFQFRSTLFPMNREGTPNVAKNTRKQM